MSAFDKIIGYEAIKNELLQICDMIHNKEIYEKLGAKLPRGILLHGRPGLGKTLMAKCLIDESGLHAYTIRRTKGTNHFIEKITDTFIKAKENAPSIVFLDDMDKFANEDSNHRDAEEYVAIQSGIDEIQDKNVFVFATANDIDKLPSSLTRAGRFDRKIKVRCPAENDAFEIIKYYLKSKSVADNVNLEDVARMIQYSSCAELETILNEAAINAAFGRRAAISMDDVIKAVLRMEYDSPDSTVKTSEEELRKIALHEAGHLIVSEALKPGSVGLASIRSCGRDETRGFISRCKECTHASDKVLIYLAGKAAVELYYSDASDEGCQSDIKRAFRKIRDLISTTASCGFGVTFFDGYPFPNASESLASRNEAVIHAELERCMFKVREILLKNRTFLERTAELLLQKETLLYSDIRALRESVSIAETAV